MRIAGSFVLLSICNPYISFTAFMIKRIGGRFVIILHHESVMSFLLRMTIVGLK